jgi:hypothetical protein
MSIKTSFLNHALLKKYWQILKNISDFSINLTFTQIFRRGVVLKIKRMFLLNLTYYLIVIPVKQTTHFNKKIYI